MAAVHGAHRQRQQRQFRHQRCLYRYQHRLCQRRLADGPGRGRQGLRPVGLPLLRQGVHRVPVRPERCCAGREKVPVRMHQCVHRRRPHRQADPRARWPAAVLHFLQELPAGHAGPGGRAGRQPDGPGRPLRPRYPRLDPPECRALGGQRRHHRSGLRLQEGPGLRRWRHAAHLRGQLHRRAAISRWRDHQRHHHAGCRARGCPGGRSARGLRRHGRRLHAHQRRWHHGEHHRPSRPELSL